MVEGRDIGTVVFPDAPVKVFLNADNDVRAARRRRDEEASARDVAVDVVRDALTQRDRADASLGRPPPADDAAPHARVAATSSRTVHAVAAARVARVRAAERAAEQDAGEETS